MFHGKMRTLGKEASEGKEWRGRGRSWVSVQGQQVGVELEYSEVPESAAKIVSWCL